MNFCAHCGGGIIRAVPTGDCRERDICADCGCVFYSNPKIVVGCILEWQGNILLCRRAIAPRQGYWTLPAGFMENGESTVAGALRETREESGAEALVDALFAVVDVPAISQVHMYFRGRLLSDALAPGDETLEAGFFGESRIPWGAIAFSSVELALGAYFTDRLNGSFSTHAMVADRPSPGR